MKRAAFDHTNDQAGSTAAAGMPNMRPCRTCGEAARQHFLCDHGGLCPRCFDAYCASAGSGPLGKREAGKAFLRAMNARTREREQQGEPS